MRLKNSRPSGFRKLALLATIPIAVTGLTATAHAQDAQFLVSDSFGNKVVRFDYPSGQPVDHFVAFELSPLRDARQMTYGPDGNLYVVSAENSIVRYDGKSGQYLDIFVASPTGELRGVGGLAFGPDGHLYVSTHIEFSSVKPRVLRFHGSTGASMGTFVQSGSGGLDQPRGLAFGPGGDLYVASYATSSVLRYHGTTGEFIEATVPAGAAGLSGPVGVLFDDTGRMYVSGYDSHSVIVVPVGRSPELLVSSGRGGLRSPSQMAMGPEGELVVTSNGSEASVLRFNRMSGSVSVPLLADGAGRLSPNRVGLVFMPAECRADFDGNGQLDFFDFLTFQEAFSAGCQ